jgi:pimeloyl-ACP methyl ester carboxylesterase
VITRTVSGTDGISLHVEQVGNGQPVVFVQGLGYAAWAWRSQRDAVGRVARAVVMDNRGAGRSDKPPGPYSIEQMAHDVASVIESCGGGPAMVVGASMGGYISMTLAVRRPELVAGLGLVSTLTGGPDSFGVPEETRAAWAANAARPPEEFARATMPLSLAPGWVEEHPERFEELLAARLEHPTPPEAWQAQWDACSRFLVDGVPPGPLHQPTWVVHGTLDHVVPVENAAVIKRRIPHATVTELPGAGHLCWLERPDAVNALVLDAL